MFKNIYLLIIILSYFSANLFGLAVSSSLNQEWKKTKPYIKKFSLGVDTNKIKSWSVSEIDILIKKLKDVDKMKFLNISLIMPKIFQVLGSIKPNRHINREIMEQKVISVFKKSLERLVKRFGKKKYRSNIDYMKRYYFPMLCTGIFKISKNFESVETLYYLAVNKNLDIFLDYDFVSQYAFLNKENENIVFAAIEELAKIAINSKDKEMSKAAENKVYNYNAEKNCIKKREKKFQKIKEYLKKRRKIIKKINAIKKERNSEKILVYVKGVLIQIIKFKKDNSLYKIEFDIVLNIIRQKFKREDALDLYNEISSSIGLIFLSYLNNILDSKGISKGLTFQNSKVFIRFCEKLKLSESDGYEKVKELYSKIKNNAKINISQNGDKKQEPFIDEVESLAQVYEQIKIKLNINIIKLNPQGKLKKRKIKNNKKQKTHKLNEFSIPVFDNKKNILKGKIVFEYGKANNDKNLFTVQINKALELLKTDKVYDFFCGKDKEDSIDFLFKDIKVILCDGVGALIDISVKDRTIWIDKKIVGKVKRDSPLLLNEILRGFICFIIENKYKENGYILKDLRLKAFIISIYFLLKSKELDIDIIADYKKMEKEFAPVTLLKFENQKSLTWTYKDFIESIVLSVKKDLDNKKNKQMLKMNICKYTYDSILKILDGMSIDRAGNRLMTTKMALNEYYKKSA